MDTNDQNEFESPKDSASNHKINWNRRAIIISIVVNVLILSLFAVYYISFKSDDSPSTSSTAAESSPEPASSKPTPTPEPKIVPRQGEKENDTVKRVLDEQTQAAAARTDEENLAELEKQGKRLQQISSEESIDQIADKFHSWAGTEQRATEPDPNTPIQTGKTLSGSNFDASTAQFYDVKKVRSKTTGDLKYKAVLIDAQGRTTSVELSKEDGERLYPAFQLMKQNPLVGQVYKKIVMSLIDKILNKNVHEELNQ